MWYQSQGARDRGIKQGFVCRKYEKIRIWFVCLTLSAEQFCTGDFSFVNCWIGLKFLLELLYISMKSFTGGIVDLSF